MTNQPGFEIGQCYACRQGHVFIAKSKTDGKWFVVCEECFTDWPDPESYKNKSGAGFERFGPYAYVSRDEIHGHPWEKYVENRFDLEEPPW